ncbi:hypothetical protein [Streptomyces sp. NPDC020965]|uniref:hypothetical protein n=1 Tax=Streptomyces sp. NPDC020965 TaxID=3365105 RepID=UPI00379FA34D
MRPSRHRLTTVTAGVLFAGAALALAPTPAAAQAPPSALLAQDWSCDTATVYVAPFYGPIVSGLGNCAYIGTDEGGSVHDRSTGRTHWCNDGVLVTEAPARVVGLRCST